MEGAMSVRDFDGFESYGTTGAVASYFGNRYTWYDTPGGDQVPFYNNLEVATGRLAGFGVKNGASAAACYFRLQKSGPFADGNVTVGFACKIGGEHKFFTLIELALEDDFDFVEAENFNLRTEADGNISVYFQNSLLDTTTGIDLDDSDWHYIEFNAKCHPSAGSYQLIVDGVTALSDTGLDSQVFPDAGHFIEGRYEGMEWGNQDDTDPDYQFDDMYITLDDASGLNDGVLGPRVVEAITPNADGDTTDWTPSTGTDNYALVDENPPNDDTDYNEAADSSNVTDLYQYTSLSTIVGAVNAVMILTTLKHDTSIGFYDTLWKENGTQDDDSGPSISTDYEQRPVLVEQSPDGPTNWTVSRVNGAQFGIKEDG